jgi:hypothetical protein
MHASISSQKRTRTHARVARMHDLVDFPVMKRADVVREQLEALAKRHGLTVDDLKMRWVKEGGDRVTFHRIATAQAKSEPKADNLRKIAALVGETRDQAFPDQGVPPPPGEQVVAPTDPGVRPTFALKTLGEASPELQREVENFLRYANRRAADEAHQIKRSHKQRKSNG